MSEISYSKIVFGLKHHQQLYDCRKLVELFRSLRIIISEHDAVTDACEMPGLHYHGIIEHGKNMQMNSNEAIIQLRTYCAYYKVEKCDNPEQFVLELAQPPKKMMIIEIANSFDLKAYYSTTVAGIRLELSDFEKSISKMEAIKFIIANIKARGTFDIKDIWKEIKYCYYFEPDELEILITRSLKIVQQQMLDQSILVLCRRLIPISENYYTIQESAEFVVEWCRYQNIDVEEFTLNLVHCLDKQVPYRNSLYFQGSSKSGIVNIINSIADACAFVGEIDNETTGYAYVWEKCLEKRCIILRDPIFSERMFDEMEDIFRGVGTIIPQQQSVLKYLRPTPVIVLCGEADKEKDFNLRLLQTSFLKSYVNLKPYMKLTNNPRRLHPEWLSVLYNIGPELDYNASYCEDTFGRSMNYDSSCELSDELDLNSPV